MKRSRILAEVYASAMASVVRIDSSYEDLATHHDTCAPNSLQVHDLRRNFGRRLRATTYRWRTGRAC